MLYYEILYDHSMIALFVVIRFLAAPYRAVVAVSVIFVN